MGSQLDLDDLVAGHESAKAELEALRKDAERYRWLAHTFSAMSANIDGNHYWQWRGNAVQWSVSAAPKHCASMDEAVDAGMARRLHKTP